jgi:hypothetical protein
MGQYNGYDIQSGEKLTGLNSMSTGIPFGHPLWRKIIKIWAERLLPLTVA